MDKRQIYITIADLAELKNVSKRSIRLAINKGKYKTRTVCVQGGESYEILLSSIEAHLQEKYIDKQNAKQLIPLENPTTYDEFKEVLSDKAKQVAVARLDLIREWRKFRNSKPKKTQADKEFLEGYNTGFLYQKIYSTLGNVSIGTLQRWNRKLGNSTNYHLLLPEYNYTKGNEFRTTLSDFEKNIFMKLLLHPSKFSIGKAVSITKHILENQAQDYIPSDITFRRYAKWFRNNHYDVWILARDGEKALKDRVEQYISRDISKLNVGDVLVADGHKLSFLIQNPFTGKPARATLIGFLDWKSGYLCGYEIMLEENTQCIASALKNSILNLVFIPKIAYQDNGRAFKAKYFVDADFREEGFQGLYGKLGIKVVFAKPYNARAKVIERFFLEFQESFEKLMPTYSGSSIENKPAHFKRNEKLHRKWFEQVSKGYVPTIDEVKQLINAWLEFKHAQPCPNAKNKTIKEVYNERIKQNIDVKKLDDLMMVQKVKTIQRNGIRFLNTFYYADALYGLRDKVIIKYCLFDLSYIRVFTKKGDYLCTAKRVTGTHPMAYHIGDIKDMEDFKQKIQKQIKLKNRTIKAVKKYLPKEDLKFIENQIIMENSNNKEVKKVHIKKKKLFHQNYL